MLFSLDYAAVVFISIISNLKALQLTEISNVYVSSNASYLIAVSAMGYLVFGEEISVLKIIRIVIMLTAVFFVFIGLRNKNSKVWFLKEQLTHSICIAQSKCILKPLLRS